MRPRLRLAIGNARGVCDEARASGDHELIVAAADLVVPAGCPACSRRVAREVNHAAAHGGAAAAFGPGDDGGGSGRHGFSLRMHRTACNPNRHTNRPGEVAPRARSHMCENAAISALSRLSALEVAAPRLRPVLPSFFNPPSIPHATTCRDVGRLGHLHHMRYASPAAVTRQSACVDAQRPSVTEAQGGHLRR